MPRCLTRRKRVSKRSTSRTRVPEFPKECNNWSLEYIATCQWEDVDINPACQWVDAGYLPSWERVKGRVPIHERCIVSSILLCCVIEYFTVYLWIMRGCRLIIRLSFHANS